MKETWPRAGGGHYEAGTVYDFPRDVAQRWIAEGRAEAVKKERGEAPKEENK